MRFFRWQDLRLWIPFSNLSARRRNWYYQADPRSSDECKVRVIERLLCRFRPDDVILRRSLARLAGLIKVQKDRIHILHVSLLDFFSNDGKWFINKTLAETQVLLYLLRQLKRRRREKGPGHNLVPFFKALTRCIRVDDPSQGHHQLLSTRTSRCAALAAIYGSYPSELP